MAEFLPFNGIISAKDKDTENKVQLTAVQDPDGEWVLRMVDASPFAYENATDTLKVKVQNTVDVGEVKKFTTKRIMRSGVLGAGLEEILLDTEKEIIIHSILASTDEYTTSVRMNMELNGSAIVGISDDGTDLSTITLISPNTLELRNIPFFELIKNDSENDKYVYGWKSEYSNMNVTKVKLSIRNADSEDHNMAVLIYYSEVM